MTYLFGALIFWSGAFFGFIAAALFMVGKDADEYEAHTDYDGRS